MSTYQDYNAASRLYDYQRSGVGADVMAAMIQFHSGKQLKDLHIFDAGCGTGNYAKALIEYGVGHVTLLDASSGMLEKAKVKLADAIDAGTVNEVVEATMPPIPFPDASFDAVMLNLVLHHIDTERDTDFPKATKTLQEASRVLRPGGVVIISSILPAVGSYAIWYTQLNLKLTERFQRIVPSVEQFQHMFDASSMACVQKLNILGSNMNKHYYNFEGPLDQSWLDSISYWSYATEEELGEVKRKVIELKEEGKLEQWAREHDHVHTSGFLTIFVCKHI